MAHQDVKIKVTYITRADLESLFLRFRQVRVEAGDEKIYFEGVKNHLASNKNGFRHFFETVIKRNGETLIWGTVTLESTDNEIFTGTIEYTRW